LFFRENEFENVEIKRGFLQKTKKYFYSHFSENGEE